MMAFIFSDISALMRATLPMSPTTTTLNLKSFAKKWCQKWVKKPWVENIE